MMHRTIVFLLLIFLAGCESAADKGMAAGIEAGRQRGAREGADEGAPIGKLRAENDAKSGGFWPVYVPPALAALALGFTSGGPVHFWLVSRFHRFVLAQELRKQQAETQFRILSLKSKNSVSRNLLADLTQLFAESLAAGRHSDRLMARAILDDFTREVEKALTEIQPSTNSKTERRHNHGKEQ
jgi:hypothetical protein